MRIAVNTRLLIPGRLDGIGRFTYETLMRITQRHGEHQFVFLFDRKIPHEFLFSPNVTAARLLPPARRPWLFRLWLDYSVAHFLRRTKPDVFLSPDGFLPLRTATPCLPVIHDLNFEHYPEDLPPAITKFYKTYFPQFAKNAERIATVSEFSKQDIVKQYKIAPGKIDVVYNGASEGFRALNETEIADVRKKYAQGTPYFLFVGSLHPRKNLVRLLQAFDQFRAKQNSNAKLLIVGQRYWSSFDLEQTISNMKHKDEVIFTGRLAPEELHRVMGAARALAYVPYFEGFGIPIVEAMRCNVPVLTANVSSMPEVGGEAVRYADPFSVDSITEGLLALDSDETLRQQLLAKAKLQREKFSWDKSAELLWNSILKTAGETGSDSVTIH